MSKPYFNNLSKRFAEKYEVITENICKLTNKKLYLQNIHNIFRIIHIRHHPIMIRLLVLSIAILASSLSTFADNRNHNDMLRIAQERLANKSMAKGASAINEEVKVMKDADQFAIYGAKNAGFVVVSRSNTFPAIIGVCNNDYDSTNVAPGFKWWMENISKSMAYIDANNLKRTSLTVPETISSFITTQWNQGSPYNLLCPKVSSTLTHGYTGCVATAMAQILKYYNYPATGKGNGKYYVINGKDTTAYSADISTTYDWNNMSNNYNKSSILTTPNKAVAQLMQDVGIGVNMEYGTDGSAAYDDVAAASFVNNFSYNPYSLKILYKLLYSNDEWAEMIYNEIKNKRPILYGGLSKTNEGHAFVFDGINTEGNVHVNWGWGGYDDGWFDILDLTPGGTGGEFGTGTTFSENNDMVIGFDPQATATGSDFSIWATQDKCELAKSSDSQLSLDMVSFYNFSYKTFNGDLAIIYENINTNEITPNTILSDISYGAGRGFSFKRNPISLNIPDLATGTYKVYLASKAKNETNWSRIRSTFTNGVIPSYTLTKASDGSATLTSISNVVSSTENSDKTARIYDINGRLVNTTNDINTIQGKGIYITKQGNVIKKVCKQ